MMFKTCAPMLFPFATLTTALALSATFLCGCNTVSRNAGVRTGTAFARTADNGAGNRPANDSPRTCGKVACSSDDPFLTADNDRQPEPPPAETDTTLTTEFPELHALPAKPPIQQVSAWWEQPAPKDEPEPTDHEWVEPETGDAK